MTDPVVSHGRGGIGNIRPDSTPYTDGEIVREGPLGETTDGAFSTGRGGQGNIGAPHLKSTGRTDSQEVVPESAMRPSTEDRDYHTGRGGGGNVYHAQHPEKETEKDKGKDASLADKLKEKIIGKPKTPDETVVTPSDTKT